MAQGLLKRMRIGLHRTLIHFGIDVRKKRADRKLLEQVIFPEILKTQEYQHILFVGCAWYTMHYPKIFCDRDFTTMEIMPEESQYGAPKHVVDSCENIDKHFDPNSLDVIVFNGVYGAGLNEMEAIDRTLRAIHQSLRPGGLLIFGWNDLPSMAPYPFESLKGLHVLEPYVFPPLKTAIHAPESKNRHRFHFYRKRQP
jgi:SAM-dependent methyltransferase